MAYETLLLNRTDGVGTITLNRPEKLNALSSQLFGELGEVLAEFQEDDAVRAIMVTGAGRAFSAGADIHEMTGSNEGARRVGSGARSDWLEQLAFGKKPTIGVINGLAYGGGALMSSIFDIRLGCEHSSFRFLAVTYGRINSAWTLPLIVGMPVAKDMLFTGRVVQAEEAYRIGLLNRLVPATDLMKTALDMGRLIAKSDPATVQTMRKILNTGVGMGWREMLENEARQVAESLRPPPPRESFKEFLDRKAIDR